MRNIKPKCKGTVVLNNKTTWIPSNFEDFLTELDNITTSCNNNCLTFRGHSNSKWLLESTFVRSCKKLVMGIEPSVRPSTEIQGSVEYNQVLFALLLFKFDLLVKPSNELKRIERQKPKIDPYFELFKRYQQHPNEDECPIKGTFFLDWTMSKDVAIFFANHDADEQKQKLRETKAAIFICDATITGKTLQREKN